MFEAYKKAYSELSVYTQKQRNMEVLRDIEVLKKENQELKKQIETMYGYIEEKLVPLMSVAVCQLERNPELRTKLEKKGYRMKLFLETEKEAREEMLKKKEMEQSHKFPKSLKIALPYFYLQRLEN